MSEKESREWVISSKSFWFQAVTIPPEAPTYGRKTRDWRGAGRSESFFEMRDLLKLRFLQANNRRQARGEDSFDFRAFVCLTETVNIPGKNRDCSINHKD